MSTYGQAGVTYGMPSGTYGDLALGDVPAEAHPVPTPTYATGATGMASVAGGAGASTVTGRVGTTVAAGGIG